eukprot:CAMPEP_0119534754 /NCGR_PEP_ID=MMETSP1344-20130328/47936_1 /TAXON_ID=236787 /ORGANISM="Florenciella parvula, Strain CCMP2471" /LENGTH=56 /DNA_ID=CAMNT_0007576121 /DNA_START=133 /DNA_END=300 /DNA_ORIENTATION=-
MATPHSSAASGACLATSAANVNANADADADRCFVGMARLAKKTIKDAQYGTEFNLE